MESLTLPPHVLASPFLMTRFYEGAGRLVLGHYASTCVQYIDAQSESARIFIVLRRSSRLFIPVINLLYRDLCAPFLSSPTVNGGPPRGPLFSAVESTVTLHMFLDGQQGAFYYSLFRVSGLLIHLGDTSFD